MPHFYFWNILTKELSFSYSMLRNHLNHIDQTVTNSLPTIPITSLPLPLKRILFYVL